MYKTITLVLLSLLVFQSANSAQNKYNQPSPDQSLWRNQFAVLLADDANAKKTRKVIEKIMAKDFLDMPLGTFKKHQPTSVSTLLRV